jgi:hypothetical protein
MEVLVGSSQSLDSIDAPKLAEVGASVNWGKYLHGCATPDA